MNNKRKIITDILGSYRRAGDEHLYHSVLQTPQEKDVGQFFDQLL